MGYQNGDSWNFDDDCCALIDNGAMCVDDDKYEFWIDWENSCAEGDWGVANYYYCLKRDGGDWSGTSTADTKTAGDTTTADDTTDWG